MDVASRLQAHPLFGTFTPEALSEVVRIGTPIVYQPGDVCIGEGEAGEIIGVLLSGQLEAVRARERLEPQRIGTIHPGECFGEMSLLTGNPTRAHVVAVQQSEAVIFPQEAIAPLIAVNPEAVRFLTRLITSRLAPTQEPAGAAPPASIHYSLGATSPARVLALSCRKEDIRYRYFDTTSEQAHAGGAVVGLGSDEAVHSYWGPGVKGQQAEVAATHEAAVAAILAAPSGSCPPWSYR